jgi:phosphoglycolate phosphatase-like HAD superfamily hydrolase
MIDWRQIQDVLLDMDGTLLDLHFDNHFWQEVVPLRYAQGRGLDVVTAKAVLNPIFRRSEGSLNWYCLDYWTRELKIDIATLKKEATHLIAIHPHVIEFLDALRAAGKRTALVTNAHPKSLALKLEHTRLGDHLDTIVSAHDIGHPKEQIATISPRCAAPAAMASNIFWRSTSPTRAARLAKPASSRPCVTSAISCRLPSTNRLFFGIKLQGDGIDAVTLAGRSRSVVEDMPQMGAASTADHLGACHPVTGIDFYRQPLVGHGLPETRPTAARIEFGVGIE